MLPDHQQGKAEQHRERASCSPRIAAVTGALHRGASFRPPTLMRMRSRQANPDDRVNDAPLAGKSGIKDAEQVVATPLPPLNRSQTG